MTSRRFLAPLIMRVIDFKDAERVLRSLDDRIRQLIKVPIVDGILFENLTVTTAGTSVIHGLDRVPVGVSVVKSNTTDSFKIDAFNNTSFDLTSSAGDSIVSLWVF